VRGNVVRYVRNVSCSFIVSAYMNCDWHPLYYLRIYELRLTSTLIYALACHFTFLFQCLYIVIKIRLALFSFLNQLTVILLPAKSCCWSCWGGQPWKQVWIGNREPTPGYHVCQLYDGCSSISCSIYVSRPKCSLFFVFDMACKCSPNLLGV
jgi:hypothetical protein